MISTDVRGSVTLNFGWIYVIFDTFFSSKCNRILCPPSLPMTLRESWPTCLVCTKWHFWLAKLVETTSSIVVLRYSAADENNESTNDYFVYYHFFELLLLKPITQHSHSDQSSSITKCKLSTYINVSDAIKHILSQFVSKAIENLLYRQVKQWKTRVGLTNTLCSWKLLWGGTVG